MFKYNTRNIGAGFHASFLANCGIGRTGRIGGFGVALDKPGESGSGATVDTLAGLTEALNAKLGDIGKLAEQYEKKLADKGGADKELKSEVDKALTDVTGIKTRLEQLEQKSGRFRGGGADGNDEGTSPGERFVKSDAFKRAHEQGLKFKGTENFEVKAITSLSATQGQSQTTALVTPTRVPGMVMIPDRPFTIRDLMSPGRTNSNAIEYMKETLYTNNAASVAEAPSAPKPESTLGFGLVTTPVRTFAHFMIASKQILDDAPQLQSIIDYRLRFGLSFLEDTQLLLGTGTGTDLYGMMPQATPYAAPTGITVQAETRIDRMRLAMLQTTLALYPATGHILSPLDWAAIELTKDSQNRYLWANPAGVLAPTMWGLPVAVSFAMPVNNFMTGAFRYACQIFDREDANIAVSTEDRDNFVKNMVTILAEQRLALVVSRPQALIRGTFTGTQGGPTT